MLLKIGKTQSNTSSAPEVTFDSYFPDEDDWYEEDQYSTIDF